MHCGSYEIDDGGGRLFDWMQKRRKVGAVWMLRLRRGW